MTTQHDSEQDRIVGMLVQKDHRINQLEQALMDHGISIPDPDDHGWVLERIKRIMREQQT